MIQLIDTHNNNIVFDIDNYDVNKLLTDIYEKKYTVPDYEKKKISQLNYSIYPLYDINTEFIYLIDKTHIHDRIINRNFRFPDINIINSLNKKMYTYQNILKQNLSSEDQYIILNKIENIKNSLDFIGNFDLDIMKSKFIEIYDDIGTSKYKNLTTYIRPSYTNIIPSTHHIKPYYDLIELEKNKINTNNDTQYIRDLPIEKLLSHQKHIILNKGTSVIQYYSLIGSYFINNYLRNTNNNIIYKNIVLENIITKLWNVIITAPAFDNDIYVYRFINNDVFLENLQIDDIYYDKGFLSCTRDPYYVSNYYDFGKNLVKIKIPKNKIGYGLCLELFSQFSREQEILLAPMTKLKLIKKDNNVNYEHVNFDITMKIKHKYEFIIVDITEPNIPIKLDTHIKQISNFNNNLDLIDHDEILQFIRDTYLNQNNQVEFKLGDKYITLNIDNIIVSPAYSLRCHFVGNMTDENITEKEIVMYYIENNEIIFFIEILKEKINDISKSNGTIFVNINNFHSYKNYQINNMISINDFLDFLKKVGQIFNIDEIFISCEYIACHDNKYNIIPGGHYNVEIYNYFKFKSIKYKHLVNRNILQPFFNLGILNKYWTLNIDDVIKYTDSYELKQISIALRKLHNRTISVREFFIYIKENKCFLINELSYIITLYEKEHSKNINFNIFHVPLYKFNVNNLI